MDHDVVLQQNVITLQGDGTAMVFALFLGELLCGTRKATLVSRNMMVDRSGKLGFRYFPLEHNS